MRGGLLRVNPCKRQCSWMEVTASDMADFRLDWEMGIKTVWLKLVLSH